MKQSVFHRQKTNARGFTIVELMIATLVFSIILLVITYGVLHFTSDYYKGVNTSATQAAASKVIDNITQAIQSSGTVPNPTANYVCIGSQQFVYTLGAELPATNAISQINDTTGCAITSHVAANGTELLQNHMRLTQLAVCGVGGAGSCPTSSPTDTWKVSVTVAYGDNDLLCDPSLAATGAGGCDPAASPISDAQTVAAGPKIHCKVQTGSQYCAVSSLSTTVTRRLE